jgi:YHYH protein
MPVARRIGVDTLDACNGKTTDGKYSYHATKSYPYFLSCYAGTAIVNR